MHQVHDALSAITKPKYLLERYDPNNAQCNFFHLECTTVTPFRVLYNRASIVRTDREDPVRKKSKEEILVRINTWC